MILRNVVLGTLRLHSPLATSGEKNAIEAVKLGTAAALLKILSVNYFDELPEFDLPMLSTNELSRENTIEVFIDFTM